MIKILTSLLLLTVLVPSVEAGFSPEGKPRKRCRSNGGVLVCRVPKPKKCTLRNPCIPRGYHRPNPPKFIYHVR